MSQIAQPPANGLPATISLSPPPDEWGISFRVTELPPPPGRRDVPVAGVDAYRTPPPPELPGVSIAWKEHHAEAWVMWILMLAVLIAVAVFGVSRFGFEPRMVCCFALIGLPFVLILLTARTDYAVRAEHDGLHWQRAGFFGRRIDVHLPAAEIDQLLVRRMTHEGSDGEISISHAVYVRDRSGRDHELGCFENRWHARWVGHRLAHHLGIFDCAEPGELPPGSA